MNKQHRLQYAIDHAVSVMVRDIIPGDKVWWTARGGLSRIIGTVERVDRVAGKPGYAFVELTNGHLTERKYTDTVRLIRE